MLGDSVYLYAVPLSPTAPSPSSPWDEIAKAIPRCPCVPYVPQTITPDEIRRIIREDLEAFARKQMADTLSPTIPLDADPATVDRLLREAKELRRAVREDLEHTCPACWVRDK